GGPLGEDVTLVGMRTLHRAGTPDAKALGGALLRLHLRHVGLDFSSNALSGVRRPSPELDSTRSACSGALSGAPFMLRARSSFLLARGDDHDHLPAFELGHLLDGGDVVDIVADSLQQAHAEFLVGHLAAPETQRDLRLVALFEEALQVAKLDLVVAFIGAGPELDFLDLDDLLLGLGLGLPFLLLVLELSIVHQAADGGHGLGRALHESELGPFSQPQGFPESDDPDGLVVRAGKTHFGCSDFTVDAMRAFRSDAAFSLFGSSEKKEPCDSLRI